jgi:hypothetical protein
MDDTTSSSSPTTTPTARPPRHTRRPWILCLLAVVILGAVAVPVVLARWDAGLGEDAADHGTIRGELLLEWLGDGWRMRVKNDLTYTDPRGRVWTVPAGYITDGASIPRSLWGLVGGPFEGKYRTAALFHDVECEKGHWGICLVDSTEVHRMFYDAMRCAGVSRDRARLMWKAVHEYGPQWQAVADAPKDLAAFNARNRADAFAVVDADVGLYHRPIAESPFIIGAKRPDAAPDPDALRRDITAAPVPAGQPRPIPWSSPEMQRLREAMRKRREEMGKGASGR